MRFIALLARALTYLVYFYVLAVEVVLFIGLFLLLFGANPSAGFTQWAYRNLEAAMEPFRGIFASVEIGTTGNDVPAVFDTSILFAMVVYGVIAMGLHAIISWLSNRIARIEREEAIERSRAEAEAARMTPPPARLGGPIDGT